MTFLHRIFIWKRKMKLEAKESSSRISWKTLGKQRKLKDKVRPSPAAKLCPKN